MSVYPLARPRALMAATFPKRGLLASWNPPSRTVGLRCISSFSSSSSDKTERFAWSAKSVFLLSAVSASIAYYYGQWNGISPARAARYVPQKPHFASKPEMEKVIDRDEGVYQTAKLTDIGHRRAKSRLWQ